MRTLLVLILIASIPTICVAQNLVPNSGFEQHHKVITRWSGTFQKFNTRIKEWNSPTQGSPDIILDKARNKMFPHRKGFDLNPHLPRTGRFMVGIKTFGCQQEVMHCREYLQVKLRDSLIIGDEYYVEFYINPLQESILVNNLGVAFSVKRVKEIFSVVLADRPPKVNETKVVALPPGKWHKVSGSFIADSTYQHLIIGNFFPDESTRAIKKQAAIRYSFLFIDDVFLENRTRQQIVPKKIKAGDVITLNHVQFEFDKAALLPSSYPILNQVVDLLQQETDYKIEIKGFTDNVGSTEFNLKLSRKRARAVYDFFLQTGTSAQRLTFQGFGEAHPVAANDTKEGRQKNRRVELHILE